MDSYNSYLFEDVNLNKGIKVKSFIAVKLQNIRNNVLNFFSVFTNMPVASTLALNVACLYIKLN